jgi:hypothetical protein
MNALRPRHAWLILVGIGAASAAAHIGNNFTTYLVGGLIDRFGFRAGAMGAFSTCETMAYAAAMFLVAPRAGRFSARVLGIASSVLVVGAQALSADMHALPLLLAARLATGLGFGLMNSAVNLAAGQTEHPARAISTGLAFQTLLFAAMNIGVPMVGARDGVAGMFVALAAVSGVLGLGALLLPGRRVVGADTSAAVRPTPLDARAARILAAMALFAVGTMAIWPFMERAGHAIGIPATQFGQFQSAATLAAALGNMVLVAVAARLPRQLPLALALIACGSACAGLTTVPSAPLFAGALILYNVSWFVTYPLLLGLAYATDPSGRLAVMTTGTWMLSQSLGSLAAGYIAQAFAGYTVIGPIGAGACVLAVAIIAPLAGRIDREGGAMTPVPAH